MRQGLRESLNDVLNRAGLTGVASARVLVVACCAIGLILLCAVRWWPSRGAEFDVETTAAGASETVSRSTTLPASSEGSVTPLTVYVHVVGAVRRPGVVCIPQGSRVAECIDSAGGLLSNAQPRAVNLARLVVDGEQILVPTLDEWQSGQAAGPTSAPSAAQGPGATESATSRVNLNTADAAALDALPGVGPSTAAKIIADREANGPFAAPEDLMRVSGIGTKKYEALKEFLTVQ